MTSHHAAWLGWPNNMTRPRLYNTVVTGTTAGYASIDGFISDTAKLHSDHRSRC